MSVSALNFNVTIASLTNHNTSAYSAYNQANFGANFGTNTWVDQSGDTVAVDPTKMDLSLNPITPGHVSKMDVHTLIPSRPDLRWFAHATPWFGSSSHISIGLNCNTTTYVAAMITDMKNRGFNGVIIDWYGQGHSTDGVTQKIKSYLQGIPGNTFTYAVMVDKGVQGGVSTNNLVTQIQYCQTQYFSDTNYEHEPLSNGKPILLFFGVRSALGSSAMDDLKIEAGGNMVWVEQGTGYLGESWEDQCFEWTEQFNSGVNPTDPFNLTGVTRDYASIRSSGKKAFGAMCGNFNGMLTKSVSWSMGKYLPSSNGLCVVQRAATINSQIPANMTRMQWTTWSDWEEGTQVETGIENGFALNAQVNQNNVLSWAITGDARTVDHYEIYAATNGTYAALLGTVRTGVLFTNISSVGLPPGNYQLYVDAVAKPCIRDHISPPVSYSVSASPAFLQQPTNAIVGFGDTAIFTATASGSPTLFFAWRDQSNNVVGNTNTLVVTNASSNNSFYVVVTNQYGSITSSPALLTVVGAPVFIADPGSYNRLQITFTGYTNSTILTNFPVLVRLSTNVPGFSYSQFVAGSNGADLRFTTPAGLELPFEIEQWNPSGESQVWVQVPTLGSSTDSIFACWGNASDSGMQPCNTNGTVWVTPGASNNFIAVYHLSQGGFPFTDSTLQYPASSGVAPSSNTGIIGRGCAFNGTSQFLDPGVVNVGKTFTASAWVNISPSVNNEQTIWCNKQGGWNTAGFDFYVNSYQTNDGKIYFDTADGVGGNVSSRTVSHAVSFGQWHLLTGTLDGVNGSVHVYVDGLDQTINSGVDTAFQVTNYVRCSGLLTGTPGASSSLLFNGSMDEARLESGVRSPAWVWASWATVASSNFVTLSSVMPSVAGRTLSAQMIGGQLVLSWITGTLQSAPAVSGPFTDISPATAPYNVNPAAGQQYFRIRLR
ncbi:MAG TPA: hypothetical protein VLT36_15560 [Candidatus Dormibacteraeota bacterium]|nr:hypothetical protein [Candidatus Dormibacteraeota bacterium]